MSNVIPDTVRTELAHGGRLLYAPRFLPRPEADELFAELMESLAWEQRDVVVFGRRVAQPRLTCWIADFAYTYSGLTLPPSPWPEPVQRLREQVEEAVFGVSKGQFGGVLANLYRDGRDAMGLHADDEPELLPDAEIASVSLGAERRFVLKLRDASVAPYELRPAHGSLLVMAGTLQRHWRHGVPREARVAAPRINLTFRQYRRLSAV
jgi:alkylated DNA repair dioxygenase AlkB